MPVVRRAPGPGAVVADKDFDVVLIGTHEIPQKRQLGRNPISSLAVPRAGTPIVSAQVSVRGETQASLQGNAATHLVAPRPGFDGNTGISGSNVAAILQAGTERDSASCLQPSVRRLSLPRSPQSSSPRVRRNPDDLPFGRPTQIIGHVPETSFVAPLSARSKGATSGWASARPSSSSDVAFSTASASVSAGVSTSVGHGATYGATYGPGEGAGVSQSLASGRAFLSRTSARELPSPRSGSSRFRLKEDDTEEGHRTRFMAVADVQREAEKRRVAQTAVQVGLREG